jgi:hypothetical protein
MRYTYEVNIGVAENGGMKIEDVKALINDILHGLYDRGQIEAYSITVPDVKPVSP